MQKITLTVILLFGFLTTFSQEINVIDGLISPLGLVRNGNDLFICEHANPNQGIISKIDITESNPIKTDLITGLTYPRAMALVGDELYFADFYISKFNVNDENPSAIQIMYASIQPRALLYANNFLYVSSDNAIYKVDVNAANPTFQLVLGNIEARTIAFALKGDELFYGYANKVSKFNITDTNPVSEEVATDLESGVYSLTFYNDQLLIGMALIKKIVRMNLNASNPQVENFISTVVGSPMNMLVIEDDLYIAGGSGNTVFRIEDISNVLSVGTDEPMIATKVFPNPSSDTIHVIGIENASTFQVVNSNGLSVMNGKMNEGVSLDISSLSSGIYYLKLKDQSLKEHVVKVIRK
ncbi:MAG: T9SS type A sorting domain-containing protein [Aquaticitalea sp.]